MDLVFTSPPYEDARLYGELNYKVKGQDWVDWCMPRYLECLRVCKGLVAWVVEGKTRQFKWSATPALLMADLHRAGVKLRKPPVFHRVGIPGSGGKDWLRNDWEFIVCASHGKLPWSDNTAMGQPCKYGVGGEMSYRTQDGQRRNARTGRRLGSRVESLMKTARPRRGVLEPQRVEALSGNVDLPENSRLYTTPHPDGTMRTKLYRPPKKANPGNVITCKVGGGHMGHRLASENEAPMPESLTEYFIRSFCPPSGVVLDPFCGSGTTPCVAKKHGRHFVGFDLRQSQVDLSLRRLADPIYTPNEG